MAAIGIDLGTTNCCISAVIKEKAEVIVNRLGDRTTCSVIGLWNKNEVVIGSSAKEMVYKYPKSIVSGVKYNIGKKFNNYKESTIMLVNHDNKLKYNVRRGDADVLYLPEELSALMLKSLKSFAESFLDKNVTKAVITVPTYFDDSQREATISVGKIAGFKEVKLLNESIAAAVAYAKTHTFSNNKTIFTFDFGGGTLDVCILHYLNNEFNVLAIDGDLHLGGDDITKLIFDYTLDTLSGPDITINSKLELRLLKLCEDAKKSLSVQSQYFIDVPEMNKEVLISTETFNKITNSLFDKVMSIVEKCLINSKLDINDINDIILVGGSSRIPAIQDRLEKFFKRKLKRSINPDEVVAQGAAIVAANWDKSGFQFLKLNSITAHSFGVEVSGDYMNIIIPRYSKLPIQISQQFCPEENDQKNAIINIYQGEDKFTCNNLYLGCVEFQNIAIDEQSNIRNIKVVLKITEDGVLKATITDKANNTEETTINIDKSGITEIDVRRSIVKLNEELIK